MARTPTTGPTEPPGAPAPRLAVHQDGDDTTKRRDVSRPLGLLGQILQQQLADQETLIPFDVRLALKNLDSGLGLVLMVKIELIRPLTRDGGVLGNDHGVDQTLGRGGGVKVQQPTACAVTSRTNASGAGITCPRMLAVLPCLAISAIAAWAVP